MASSRRKLDEKHLKILREFGTKPTNRTCFDCHQKGPTYINMTIGSFVCTSCSGILRGLNPPHRVKSISMASFTPEEIEQIKCKGNENCQSVWLGLYDGKSSLFPDTKDEHKIRDFMIQKYEKKRFYVDPSVAFKNVGGSNCKSGSSSNASTPGSSDSKSLGSGNTPAGSNPNTSVSRPTSSLQTAGSSPCLNGLQQSTTLKSSSSLGLSAMKPSSSLVLLSGLESSSTNSFKNQSSENGDPFGFSEINGDYQATTGFANFDNANIFSNSSASNSKSLTTLPHPSFSSNPLTPFSSSSSNSLSSNVVTSTASGGVNATSSANGPEDRYAALKDLDEIFKNQKEVEKPPQNNGSLGLFGTSPTSANAFGSSNGVHYSQNGSGTANTAYGTSPIAGNGAVYPPTTNSGSAWNPSFNPFSGTQNANTASPWSNSPAFGTFTQNQANPFAGGIDPNFNSSFGSALNGTSPMPNTNWANFNSPPNTAIGATSTKITPNPWSSNVSPNPFANSQVPLSGSPFNPFL